MSDLKSIAGKLVLIAKDCQYAQKDAKNQQQGYKYVSAAHILGKVNESLVAHNVCSVPDYSIVESKETTTAKGAKWQLVNVKLQLQIIDADTGESVIVTSLGTGTDPGDKATAKAQTMALKYAWLTALNIETGDDPEADPRTDNAELTGQPQGQPQGQRTPQQIFIDQKLQQLMGLWQQAGWDTNGMAHYFQERYKKPFEQVTAVEIDAFIAEAQDYLQKKTLQY